MLAFPLIRRRILLFLAGVSFLALRARAEAGERRQLTLIISAGLDGQFALPDCHAGAPKGRTLAHLAASVALAQQQAEAAGRTVVASVHLGDVTGPGALARFLEAQPDGAERTAALVAGSGFEYALVGKHWFDQPPNMLAKVGAQLPQRGMTLLSSNIQCQGRSDCAVLDAMPDRTSIDVDGLQVGILGVTDDSIAKSVDPTLVKGLTVEPLAETLVKEGEGARGSGDALVIAAVNMNPSRASFAELERALRQTTPRLDLVIGNQLRDFSTSTSVLSSGLGPPVVIAGHTPEEVVRVDFDAVRVADHWEVEGLQTRRVAAEQPEPALAEQLAEIEQSYCAAWDRPLPVQAAPAVDRSTFLRAILGIIRDSAKAEVAIANDGLAARDVFPLTGDISFADVFAVIRYDDTLMQADVKGSWLKALWTSSRARAVDGRHGLSWAGVEAKGDSLMVNGRPLAEEEWYSVAVPDFLARGGDDWIADNPGFKPVRIDGREPTIRELVLNALAEARPGTLLTALPHPDLSRKLRWTWTSALTLNANDFRLEQQEAYRDSRLVGTPSTVIGTEFFGRVDAAQIDHALRLTGQARYYFTGLGGELQKVNDNAFAEAVYRYLKVQRLLNERWYAPIPYASQQLDAEFTPTAGEAYHHFELGSAVGFRLIPWRPFELKLGFGIRREVFDPSGVIHPGLVIGYDLPRFEPFRIFGTPIDFETSLDYFLDGTAFQEGRLRVRVLLPLAGPLEFSAGLDLFSYRTAPGPTAIVSQSVLGITGRIDGANQQF